MIKVRTKISSKNNPKFKRASIIVKSNYRILSSRRLNMQKKWCTNADCYVENGKTKKCFNCKHKIYVRKF